MASIMVLVGFAGAFAPSEAAPQEGVGTADDPVYIFGTEDTARVVNAALSIPVSVNKTAFDNATFTSTVYFKETAEPEAVDANKYTDGKVTPATFDANGEGTVSVAADAGAGFYLIKYDVTDTIDAKYGAVTLEFYYALHLAASTASVAKAGLTEDDGTTYITGAEGEDAIVFMYDTVYTAKAVALVDENGSETAYDYTKYDFYETNLPDGIALKSDGTISGKIASKYVPSGTDADPSGTFTIYAVNIETGAIIKSGAIKWQASGNTQDAFNYIVGPVPADSPSWTSYANDGYGSVKNTDSITISIDDLGADSTFGDASTFTAKYSLGADYQTADVTAGTGTQGSVTINGLGDYTGIIQLQITEEVTGGNAYVATIHIMVVGPVVHSGLAPAVTSA